MMGASSLSLAFLTCSVLVGAISASAWSGFPEVCPNQSQLRSSGASLVPVAFQNASHDSIGLQWIGPTGVPASVGYLYPGKGISFAAVGSGQGRSAWQFRRSDGRCLTAVTIEQSGVYQLDDAGVRYVGPLG
jgi:hypothetical protein